MASLIIEENEGNNSTEQNSSQANLQLKGSNSLADSSGISPQDNFSTATKVLTQIKREMAIFKNTGEQPKCLEKIYKALKTLLPASADAERAFSAAGLFLTRIRSSLSDQSIDKLRFLQKYFENLDF